MATRPNIYSGTKFFRYIDGQEEPEIIRIYNMPKENSKTDKLSYFDSEGNKKRMTITRLLRDYRMLKVDGFIMFSVVSIGLVPDVVVALQKCDVNDNLPYVICRQGITDVFSTYAHPDEKVQYLGISISRDTCPANVKFEDCMMCTDLKSFKSIAIYLDDTLDDILKMFSNTKFDNILVQFKALNEQYSAGDGLKHEGYCLTLRELLESNNFMYDFRKCFKIMELPFHIDGELEGLDANNTLFLENELKVNIMETYLIKYSKEINLKEIKRDYTLATSIADGCKDVYIVGYDPADGKYVPRTAI